MICKLQKRSLGGFRLVGVYSELIFLRFVECVHVTFILSYAHNHTESMYTIFIVYFMICQIASRWIFSLSFSL